MQSIYLLVTRILSAQSVSAALVAMSVLVSGCATAQQHTEYGTVVSSTPVLAPVNVPQQQCVDQPQSVAPRGGTSGGGAVAGAVIGGLIGSTMGGGSGRGAATGAGVVLGAVIGDRIEANQQPQGVAVTRHCQTVNVTESRVVAYDVVYDYAGRRFSTRMSQDPGAPGSLLPVSVNVVGGANNSGYSDDGVTVTSPQVGTPPNVTYIQTQPPHHYNQPPTTVYYTEPVRPVYVAPPVYYAPPPPVFFRPPPRFIGGGTVYFRDGRRDDRRDNRPIDPPRPEDGRRWRH